MQGILIIFLVISTPLDLVCRSGGVEHKTRSKRDLKSIEYGTLFVPAVRLLAPHF